MITIDGRPAPPRGQEPSVSYRVVGAEYFTLLRIPVISGRTFRASDARLAVPLIRWYPQQPHPPLADRPQAAPVAVVDRTMAEAFWPGEDPIGKRIRVLFSPWITIVGVVSETRNWTRDAGLRPELYLSDGQEPVGWSNVLVRTADGATNVLPQVRAVLADLDASLPIVSAAWLEDVTATELGLPRMTSALTGSFAVTALVLTAAGVYALLAFMTAARTREIGVRVALGATPAAVRWLILRQSLAMATAGVGFGGLAWVGLSTVLQAQMPEAFEASTHQRVNAAVSAAVLIATIALASYVPVRRALRIDPIAALRSE
jgi:hypothetical protein